MRPRIYRDIVLSKFRQLPLACHLPCRLIDLLCMHSGGLQKEHHTSRRTVPKFEDLNIADESDGKDICC